MHILVIASLAESLIRFRGRMLKAFVDAGCQVTTLAPNEHANTRRDLAAMGIDFQTYSLSRAGLNPVKDVASVLELRRKIQNIGPDVMLSYTIKPVIYGSIAAKLAGVPRIYTMISGLGYAFGTNSFKQRAVGMVVSQLYARSLRWSEAVFFQNPDNRDVFIERGLVKPQQAVLINGSGVELDRFAVAPLPPEPVKFLLIARLIHEKGIGEYVEAARRLKAKYPDVKFRLLGPYDPNPTAIQPHEIEAWEREGVIEYLGKTDDIRPYMADTAVYVLPTFYNEGTPRSVLEAMSMGRPVITTQAPGCRETVIDGENGYLVPKRDVDALVTALERFIQQPEIITPMGQRSRALAVEKYDVDKVNAVILDTMKIGSTAATDDKNPAKTTSPSTQS